MLCLDLVPGMRSVLYLKTIDFTFVIDEADQVHVIRHSSPRLE